MDLQKRQQPDFGETSRRRVAQIGVKTRQVMTKTGPVEGTVMKPFHELGKLLAPGLIPLAVLGERRRADTFPTAAPPYRSGSGVLSLLVSHCITGEHMYRAKVHAS
jgi:hypothetical protein